MTPATTSCLVLHTSANSTIATARQGSSPPTMQDLDATNVIWGTSRPLPDETQAYVATLAPIINHARTNVQLGAVTRSFAWASSSLFAARSAGISPDGSSRADMRQNRTSRAHSTVDLSRIPVKMPRAFIFALVAGPIPWNLPTGRAFTKVGPISGETTNCPLGLR